MIDEATEWLGLTTEDLGPIVCSLLDDPAATIDSFAVWDFGTGFAGETVGGDGTFRVDGSARSKGASIVWRLILKTLGRKDGVGSEDTRAWDYWKREILAYSSGVVDSLPDGIVAPRCFGVVERPDGAFWIWLEAVPATDEKWSLSTYGRVARISAGSTATT